MKTTAILFTALLAVAPVHAAVSLTSGTWFQLNFTDGHNPANKDNFNYYIAFNTSLNSTTGNAVSMIDSLGNLYGDALNPLSLTASGWQGNSFHSGAWVSTGVATPAPGTSTWSNDEIRNFWWDSSSNDATIRIAGLDPTKQYNIYYYSKITGASTETHTVTLNGTSQLTDTRSNRWADADYDLLFTNVTPNGANGDELNFSWNGSNPFVNAILIEVVPEPSVALLGALGVLGLLRRRR